MEVAPRISLSNYVPWKIEDMKGTVEMAIILAAESDDADAIK